jgi:hypothetical protein
LSTPWLTKTGFLMAPLFSLCSRDMVCNRFETLNCKK